MNRARIAADLRATRERLVTHGWCQHRSISGDQSCILGAISRVAPGREWPVAQSLLKHLPQSVHHIAEWNDAHGRTIEDVLSLLDDAIRAEGGGAK